MNEYKYVVLKEDKDDPSLTVIEKSGITAEFTVRQVIGERLSMDKKITELKAQKKIADATVGNIESHHPTVKDIDPEQRSYIASYDAAVTERDMVDELIVAWEAALIEDDNERAILDELVGYKEDGK